MKRSKFVLACSALLSVAAFAPPALSQTPARPGAYKNFRASIYVTVDDTRRLADPAVFEREFARAMGQVRFDKVYVEVYRDNRFATDDEIERVKRAFQSKGIEVSGGVTLAAGGQGGQFQTFDYENPHDRAECDKAVRLAAKHFDRFILDDFFFYNTKSDADIAAKGQRSWTQYRLERMREVARDLVLGPAKQVNPRVKVTIKYPNWYEHFQGLGFDLEKEAHMFDGIYTGTETRDPTITDQLLQQYESYEIIRYFDNIRPDGGNGGGWVDTYDTRYADRYAEQLWDTLFAKAPEITLFNWRSTADPQPVNPGDRAAWASLPTSFDWNAMVRSYRPTQPGDAGPGWGRVAGFALEHVDRVLGALGHPIGVASYKPYQSVGEDFLQNYLGNVGLPIEMTPRFPAEAQTILLTEAAKFDPDIVAKIKGQLQAGKSVVITSGLLRALQGRGIEDVVEIWDTGHVVPVHDFLGGHGAGAGVSLNDPAHDHPAVLLPEIHFYTNDSWPVIRGVAGAKGFPILLMNRYSKGIIYVLTIPENIGDLYNLPQGVLTQIKAYIQQDFPVRIDAPPEVALFAYDNDTFVVESYRPDQTAVGISIAGAGGRLRDIVTGEVIQAAPAPAQAPVGNRQAELDRNPGGGARTGFQVAILPHSYRVFRLER